MIDGRPNPPTPPESELVRQLRRQLESAQQAEKRWRSIVEAPFDYVIIIDRDLILQYANRGAFGFSVEGIVGHTTPLDFIAKEYHDLVRAKIKAVFETGLPEYYEAYCEGPINRWFLALISPFERDEKGIQTLSIQSRDIQEQKEAEASLEESQSRFQQLAENIADCFYLLDAMENKALYVGPLLEKVLGVSGAEIYSDPKAWMTTLHPEDREEVMEGLNRLMTQEYDYGKPFEYRVQHHGQTRWVQHRAYPVRNDKQQIVRIAGIVSDITERKEAAADLLAAETRYRNLLETLPIISYVVDPKKDHPTQYISPQIEWKLGYTQQEWTTDPQLWESRIHPQDRMAVSLARDALVESGKPLKIEYRLMSKDDIAIAVREEAEMVAMAGDREAHIHGVLLDVSETEDARVAQRRAQAASLQLVQAQEEERRHLARELHDEVGQSLTMLRLLLEMMESDDLQERHARLEQARSGVQDLMSKIHDMALDLRPGMLDDLGLVPSLVWLAERVSGQSQLNVHFEHDGIEGARLPDDIETCVYRVVQEALTNCARHSGGTNVHVRVWLTDTAMNVQIEDDGEGFDCSAILEETERTGLTGIRERATALGGTFQLESRPGKGCRILVHVPRDGSNADG